MSERELKPCPFCGRSANIKEYETAYSNRQLQTTYRIGCESCGVYFKKTTRLKIEEGEPVIIEDGYQGAINAWNRRTGEQHD